MPATLQQRLREMLQAAPLFALPNGVKIYPEFAPDDADKPYVVLFVTGQRDMAQRMHFGASEASVVIRSLMDWGVQFSCWGEYMIDALAVASAVRQILLGNYVASIDLSSPDVQIACVRYENTIETGETMNQRYGVLLDLQVQGYAPLWDVSVAVNPFERGQTNYANHGNGQTKC
jgi:hypothetical protein